MTIGDFVVKKHTHPSVRVLNGVKARGRRNVEILSILQVDWPVSRQIIEKISEYISDQIHANDEPVLYSIIEGALIRYSEAVHFKTGAQKLPDPLRLGIFVDALISETAKIMEIEIVDEAGSSWSIGSGIKFQDWYRQHPGTLTVNTKRHCDETQLRAHLYQMVTSEQVRNVLRNVDCENSVLGGDMAVGCPGGSGPRAYSRGLD